MAYIPTATRTSLGIDKWGGGISAVTVCIDAPDGYGDYTARIQVQFMFPK